MKKGKKMPSIEVEGRSEASFVLVDGKIIRAERASNQAPSQLPDSSFTRLERE